MKFKTLMLALLTSVIALTSCKKNVDVNPNVDAIDPGSGAGNALITVTGSGLRNIQSAVLDLGNVPIALNQNFNTDNAILFRVPVDANVGPQHIVFTTAGGYQFSTAFTVLAVPSITSAIPLEWQAGSKITLIGNYLESAYHVAIVGTTDTATIISASAKQLVLQMPASTVNSAKLVVYNNAGSTTTDIVFVNMDNQLKLFTEDFGPGMQNWSWCTASNSTDFAVSGNVSLKASYSAGAWQGLSFHYDDPIVASDYSYLAFWIKGGANDETVDVVADAVISGSPKLTKVAVPAGVWTYFKIPVVGTFDGSSFQRLNFQMEGPSGADESIYFDDVIFVKP
ncbi:MAG: IPT/TIG domain-containing protein [Parafilimonas sp.]|nr:IPT/TIG domain-containing protein [Parafilimonas sp.]